MIEEDTNLPTGEVEKSVITRPPYIFQWTPPSKIKSMVSSGVNITLRITPYAIMVWIFAGDEFRYMVRKNVRYVPWAIKYAVWWMNQKDF